MTSASIERGSLLSGLYSPRPQRPGAASEQGADAWIRTTRAELRTRLAGEYPSLRDVATQARPVLKVSSDDLYCSYPALLQRRQLSAAEVAAAAQDGDVRARYQAQLSAYWNRNTAAVAKLAELSALQAARHGAVSDKAVSMLAEAAGADLADIGLTPQGVVANVFDINSYPSKDMTWLRGKDGHVVLLMPGDRQPIREYASLDAMRSDVASMTRNPQERAALGRHFSLYNRQDGIIYQGVDKWLGDIAGGGYDTRIAYAPRQVSGGIFKEQAARMRDASLDDAARLGRSDLAVIEDKVIGELESIDSVFPTYFTEGMELALNAHRAATAGSSGEQRSAASRAWGNAATMGAMVLLEEAAPF